MKPEPFMEMRNRQQGYTLIEVLIAMAIFAIGILAVGSMQISAIKANANSRNSITVVTYAKDRVEDLMALAYDDDQLAAGAHSVAAGSFTQATDGIDNDEDGRIDEAGETGHISIEWNVTESDLTGDGINDGKVVTVTIIRAAAGRRRRASLDFVRANM
jgi:type IV pilus assembly protein PilV